MQYVLILLAIIIAIMLIVAIVAMAIDTALAWIPASVLGNALLFWVVYTFSSRKIDSLESEKLSRIIRVEFNGKRVNWRLDDKELQKYAKEGWKAPLSLGVAAAAVATVFVLGLFYSVGFFEGIEIPIYEDISERGGVIWAHIFSGAVLYAAFYILESKTKSIFKKSVENKLNHSISRINRLLSRGEDLHSLKNSIQAFAEELDISIKTDFPSQLKRYTASHMKELLDNSSKLEKKIVKLKKEATALHTHLKDCTSLYKKIMDRYRGLNIKVQKLGNLSLIDYSDQLLAGLEGIKGYLPKRKWDKFKESLDYLEDQVEVLARSVNRVQEGKSKEEKERTDPYDTLGVPSEASYKEIKDAFRKLASSYHPDKVAPGTPEPVKKLAEEKFKEIREAYEYLIQKKEDK